MYVCLFIFYEHKKNCAIVGCPNKSARFKVHAIVVLLGWRHWNFNVCHLSFLRLVMERYAKEQRVIIVKNLLQN